MTKREHTDSYARLCREVQARYWWALWGPVIRTGLAGLGLAGALWLAALSTDCGDIRDAGADPEPAVPPVDHAALAFARGYADGLDVQAFALATAALAWAPDAESRAATVHRLAGYVVTACREVVGAALGDDCPALLMALSHRESRWRPEVTGRAPWRAVGAFQLHGAALDTFTRGEARDLRRNTMLAADWLVQCERACVGTEEALVMYATGTCAGTRGARWGARRLLRMARELRAGGGT